MDRPTGLDSPLVPKLLKVMSRANVFLYRRTHGRLGGKFPIAGFRRAVPVCLVTHQGRKSGRTFTTPLLCLQDGDRVVIVASQAGMPKNPQWYLNIRANPRVTVQTGALVRSMIARTASPEEREVLWPQLVQLYPGWADYQTWTDRVIPVVICEREAAP
ncbi:MAG: nitroreductase family deazaflavin-dependent oxidoreductase [Aeromicrobium sp.]